MKVEKIEHFSERLKYISEQLAVESAYVPVDVERDETLMYEIVEPYIQMLVDASKKFYVAVNPQAMEVINELENGHKIAAIKILRQMFGATPDPMTGGSSTTVGLKEAKDEIERVWDVDRNQWKVEGWTFKGVRFK